MFEALANGYERGLDFVLRHQFATLAGVPRHRRRDRLTVPGHPQRVLPAAGHRHLLRHSEAGQDVSFPEMVPAAGTARRDRAGRPRRRHDGDGARRRRRQRGAEQRAHVHHAQAARGARRRRVPDDRAAAAQAGRRSRAPGSTCRRRRTSPSARAPRAPSSNTRSRTPISTSSTPGRREFSTSCKSLPELRDVATDQQVAGTTLQLKIDRDMASRFGIQPQLIDDTLYDAFGQRQVAQYFTQVNTYEVVEEVCPALQGDPATLEQDLHSRAGDRSRWCRSSAFAKWTTDPVAPLSISHQGQFPAVTISFNLAAGRRARPGDRRDPEGRARTANAAGADDVVPGQRAGVPGLADDRAAADPGRAGRRLHHSRHALRELHPPADHSLDAALGGLRRAGDADVVRLRIQPDRADRHRSC